MPGSTYEATMVYLVRRGGKLEIHSDVHLLGLFGSEVWNAFFAGLDLEVKREALKDLYDPFIMGEGDYPLAIFICRKHK